MACFPIARPRKYVLLLRNGYRQGSACKPLCHPFLDAVRLSMSLESVVAACSLHSSAHDCEADIGDMMLGLAVNHSCAGNLRRRNLTTGMSLNSSFWTLVCVVDVCCLYTKWSNKVLMSTPTCSRRLRSSIYTRIHLPVRERANSTASL